MVSQSRGRIIIQPSLQNTTHDILLSTRAHCSSVVDEFEDNSGRDSVRVAHVVESMGWRVVEHPTDEGHWDVLEKGDDDSLRDRHKSEGFQPIE